MGEAAALGVLELDVDEGGNGGKAEAIAQNGHDGSASGRGVELDMTIGYEEL